jgi:MFS transporter, UMF1 family
LTAKGGADGTVAARGDSASAAAAREDAAHAAAPRPRKNDPREVFGWKVYDWANSAFSTTVAGVFLGAYTTRLAQRAVGENGVVLDLGFYQLTAKSFFPFCIGLSVFLQIFLLPVLGAIADYSHLKKRLLMLLCFVGSAATCAMFFVTGNLYLLGGLLFVVANLSFGGALVLYNAFLPEITTEDERDKVSSRGFAYGYSGGGLLLALNLLLVQLGPRLFGMSEAMAVRVSLLSAGLWWGGFSLFAFSRLKARGAARELPPGKNFLTVGVTELGGTFRELLRLRQTLRFLVGYLFYNDGVQTVIGMAAVFLGQELFVARGVETDQSFLIGIFLMVQFTAIFGALLFERVAGLLGTKAAIALSLVVWAGIVVYAYGWLQTTRQAWLMAGMIAVVLGGSQALSRSLFSRMIPAGRESSFFGLYEVSERGTSWLGPIVFAAVVGQTNSYRQAILSLIVFFAVGLLILLLTDTDRAVRDAGNALPEEAAHNPADG